MQPVACPQCGEPASLTNDNPWRPFCSERCKMIDLGEWFEETRSIPSESPDWGDHGDGEPPSYQ
ncbi:MAG: DNA gyrase inhibitor YacG [Oceanococcus sp.]|nr:MAG: DNA gyrase inhibitor YacG [Oceanococcus sp.]